MVARRAVKDIEGKDIDDLTEYLDSETDKYRKMVDWVREDTGVSSLRYQTMEDMVKAIGLPREKLCLQCWTGKCSKRVCSRNTNSNVR